MGLHDDPPWAESDDDASPTDDEAPVPVELLVQRMPMGALILWGSPSDTGRREVGVLMKLPVRKAAWAGVPVGAGHIELHRPIPEGPVVRFLFQVFDQPEKPLTLDAFLNPADPDHREMLTSLRKQERLLIYGYGEHGQKLGTKEVPWHTQHRQGCMKIMVETEGVPVMWPWAMERIKAEYPL